MKQHQLMSLFWKKLFNTEMRGEAEGHRCLLFLPSKWQACCIGIFLMPLHFSTPLKICSQFLVVCINLTIYYAVSLFFGCKSLCLIQGRVCWWPPGHVAVSQEDLFSWALKAFVFLTFSSLFEKPVDVHLSSLCHHIWPFVRLCRSIPIMCTSAPFVQTMIPEFGCFSVLLILDKSYNGCL